MSNKNWVDVSKNGFKLSFKTAADVLPIAKELYSFFKARKHEKFEYKLFKNIIKELTYPRERCLC